MITLIAHRSGPDLYPEQTITSARRALENGADIVEMDIQYTRDGVPVICHDPSCLRMFGVDRPVTEMTEAEFLALRHASDRAYASHSLADVLDCGVFPLLLHCKLTGDKISHLAQFIAERGCAEKCVIGVQNADDVVRVKNASKDIRVLSFMPKLEQLDSFLESDAEYIRIWEQWEPQKHVERIHAAGKQMWIMSNEGNKVGIATVENMHFWRDIGSDAILINDVPWAINALK